MRHLLLLWSLLPATLPTVLCAQVAPPPALLTAAPPCLFTSDPDEDGTVWVRGARYKLGFGATGATFQPLFGPRAPRDYPVQFALASCRVGPGNLERTHAAAWQRRDGAFVRDHGMVRECWQVELQHAQQYFELEPPDRAGDVQLRIAATCDLAVQSEGPGVRFVAPGLGEVRYSDAVVIDARGRRLDLPVMVDGSELVITVPATFTAQAAWPIVVDPLVTTFAVDNTISDMQDAKVVCEPNTGNWLVVVEEHLSATDVDILCRRYDAANPPVLLDTVYAENTPNFTHNPDVGFVAQSQRFLIAWHDASGSGRFRWRTRLAGSLAQTAPVEVSVGIGSNLGNRPVVGSTMSSGLFLLVLFRETGTFSDMLAVLFHSVGQALDAQFLGPVVAPASGSVVPGAISVANSLTDLWVVIWRECTTVTCATQQIRMQTLVSSGGVAPLVIAPAITLATDVTLDAPTVAGRDGRLLAAWSAFDSGSNSMDLHGVPIGVLGGVHQPLGPVQNLSAQEPNVNQSLSQRAPSLSDDGCRFVYGYLEQDGTGIERVCAATVLVDGAAIEWHEGHLLLSSAPTQACRTIDVGNGVGANRGWHFATWQQDSATLTGDVHAAWIDARTPGVTSGINQTGCGAPVEPGISLSGTPALGRTFTVTLDNVAVLPVLLVGAENISQLPCSGCMVGVDVATMQAFLTGSLSVAVPCNPALIQFRLAFQGLSLLQPGGCPASFLGFDFALSDTLTVQVL